MTLANFKLDPPTLKESGVTLAIRQDPNFELYLLDGENGFFASTAEEQKRCDGVLVGRQGDKGVVIFFELKSGDAKGAAEQLRTSVEYFCKNSQTGNDHHRTWQQTAFPHRNHLVYVVLVGSSKRFKRSDLPAKMAGKPIHYRTLRSRKKKVYSFAELLKELK